MMRSLLRAACALLFSMTLMLGLVYPLSILVVAQLLFHDQANGSLIVKDGRVIGSALLGQEFKRADYFWSRPSATTPPYNAAASGASHLGPSSEVWQKQLAERAEILRKADPKNTDAPSVDLLTASGSGLDPHISLEAAYYQAARVAIARKVKPEVITALIDRLAEKPVLGFFGEARVNVLQLNLELDKIF